MMSLHADQATMAVLCQANELAQVHDPLGKVMGFFVPIDCHRARLEVESYHTGDFVKVFRGQFKRMPLHVLWQIFERFKSLTDDPAQHADLQKRIEQKIREDEALFHCG